MLHADKLDSETTVHELAGHIYLRWARRHRTKQWEQGVALLRQNQDAYEDIFHEATNNDYADLTGVALQEEILAWAMGDQGVDLWMKHSPPGVQYRLRHWRNSSQQALQEFLPQGVQPKTRLDTLTRRWNLDLYDNGLQPGTLSSAWPMARNLPRRSGRITASIGIMRHPPISTPKKRAPSPIPFSNGVPVQRSLPWTRTSILAWRNWKPPKKKVTPPAPKSKS